MTISIDFGFENQARKRNIKRAMNGLKPLLGGWRTAILRYSQQCDYEDVPYWYGERANISLLAAGAWRSGMIALEEYPTDKSNNKSALDRGTTRCDLYVLIGGKHDFQFEAKHKWMRAQRKDKSINRTIAATMKIVGVEARRNTVTTKRVGCVFFVPSWSTKSKYKDDPDAHIQREISRYTSNNKHADCWAWCFPKMARKLRNRESKGDNRYWPGVIMGIKAGQHFRY